MLFMSIIPHVHAFHILVLSYIRNVIYIYIYIQHLYIYIYIHTHRFTLFRSDLRGEGSDSYVAVGDQAAGLRCIINCRSRTHRDIEGKSR